MDIQHCYHILGLSPDASRAEIKAAYRARVKAYHPDQFTNSPWLRQLAEDKLKEINLAYTRVKRQVALPKQDRSLGESCIKEGPSTQHPKKHKIRNIHDSIGAAYSKAQRSYYQAIAQMKYSKALAKPRSPVLSSGKIRKLISMNYLRNIITYIFYRF